MPLASLPRRPNIKNTVFIFLSRELAWGFPLTPFPPFRLTPQGVSDGSRESAMSENKEPKLLRSKVMRLRVSDDEYERHHANAKKGGFASVSDYFRWALGSENLSKMATPKKGKPKRVAVVRELDQKLLYEVNAIGVNMNQIARGINLALLTDGEISEVNLLNSLVKIENKLVEILERHEREQHDIASHLAEKIKDFLPREGGVSHDD